MNLKYKITHIIFQAIIRKSWMEPLTSIQIQNYDGPIYLHGPVSCSDDISKGLYISKDCHRSSNADCSCVSKPTTICIPINTASESSCNSGFYGNNPQCSAGCPPQCDTQIYYSMEPAKSVCPKEFCSVKHCPRDECNHRCTKCY